MGATPEQHIAIGEEVRTSIELINAGLRQLQSIDSANDFYHLPMLTLASGFERLMKTIICFHTLNETGNYPTYKELLPEGRKGHDLIFLLDKIIERCFNQTYLERVTLASDDVDCLRSDTRLREVVKILSDFGMGARYYNLDVVCNKKPMTSHPDKTWTQLEMALLIENYDDWESKLKDATSFNRTYKGIITILVKKLEIFTRALVRLFTIGELGDEAKRHTGTIAPFLFLRDDELGKRVY